MNPNDLGPGRGVGSWLTKAILAVIAAYIAVRLIEAVWLPLLILAAIAAVGTVAWLRIRRW